MRTLIINGHPDKNSFCKKITDEYERGALEKGGEVKRVDLINLRFDPILRNGYRVIQPLEPDLLEMQNLIKWCNQIVFIYPIWWSAPPALLKGFLDRVLLPSYAFKYREDSDLWDKLLVGRRGRIIVTSDAPVWFLYLNYFHPAVNMMKKAVLEFCGISPVSVTSFGGIKNTDQKKREEILYKVYRIGLDDN